jgi:hypothetical protein
VDLISCDNCATVLDAEKLPFAADCRAIDDFGKVREDLFAFVPCPSCAGQLLKPGSLK